MVDEHAHHHDRLAVLAADCGGPAPLLPTFALRSAVFGYITASLTSFFVGRDAACSADPLPEISALRGEFAALRRQIERERGERQA